jgi:hypothetical protein
VGTHPVLTTAGLTTHSGLRILGSKFSSQDSRSQFAKGRLAQLVRAPALQAGGRRFESCTAHHFPPIGNQQLAFSVQGTTTLLGVAWAYPIWHWGAIGLCRQRGCRHFMLRKQNRNKISPQIRQSVVDNAGPMEGYSLDIARVLFQLRSNRRHLDRAIDALEAVALGRRRGKKPVRARRKQASKASGHARETWISSGLDNGSQDRITRVIPMAMPQR